MGFGRHTRCASHGLTGPPAPSGAMAVGGRSDSAFPSTSPSFDQGLDPFVG